jgi:hypothetical protein
MYLIGKSEIVHIFHRMRKKSYQSKQVSRKPLHMSDLCSQPYVSMHSELIIQVKCMRELTYLRRDQLVTTSQFFFFITTSCWQMTRSLSQHRTSCLGHAHTPMAFRRDPNLLPSRGLVRMSANWFSVGMNESETTSDSTRSRKK